VADMMTTEILEKFEIRIAQAAIVDSASARIVKTIQRERYPFKITPELEHLTLQKLKDVLARGNYGELVPQQWNIINRMLDKSMRSRGEGVTHDEVEGIMEMATEHLWSPAMTMASQMLAKRDAMLASGSNSTDQQ